MKRRLSPFARVTLAVSGLYLLLALAVQCARL